MMRETMNQRVGVLLDNPLIRPFIDFDGLGLWFCSELAIFVLDMVL